jgi:hypothetical protein
MENTSPVTLTLPTVHLNGTSRDELQRQIFFAITAIENAIRKLNNAAPNGRDYYPQGQNAWGKANDQHVARVGKLVAVVDELEAIATALEG